MATKSNKDGRLASEEENRKDALAATPEKDELQLKREAQAEQGLAHGSLNGYAPDKEEAKLAGNTEDSRDNSDPNLEAGNAVEGKNTNVGTSIEDEKARNTPAGKAAKAAEKTVKNSVEPGQNS